MKKIIYFLLISILIISGINYRLVSAKVNSINTKEAIKIGNEYMCALADEDVNIINKLSINNVTDLSDVEVDKINGFILKDYSEGTKYIYLNYLVVRNEEDKVDSDLDKISLVVIKQNEEYKIKKIIAQNEKEVYMNNNELRFIDSEVGSSELLLRKKDIPKDAYPKREEIVLAKEDVPNGEFGKITINYLGDKVVFSINGDNKTFIALAVVEEATQTSQEENQGSEQESSDKSDIEKLEESFEKPMVNKIVPYDIVEGYAVDKMVFSGDNSILVVQMSKNNKSILKIYENPTGKIADYDLEKVMDSNKNMLINKSVEEGVIIDVVDNNNITKYLINTEKKNISKI